MSESQSTSAAMSQGSSNGPGLVRISIGLFLLITTSYIALFGMLGVLLPSQIAAAVGEPGKEAALGVVSTVGAVVAMIAGPLFGAWSDRTRSRWGKRAPWLLGGASAGLVALNVIGVSQQIVVIGLGWCLSQLAFNALIMVSATVLPDRVPTRRRGIASGVVGAGTAIGLAASQALGAAFVESPLQGTLVLSILAFAGSIAYILIAPEHPSANAPDGTLPAARPRLRDFLLHPRTSPDFSWAWLGRFTMTLGYYLIASRLLYFVQDRLSLGITEAAGVLAGLGAVSAAAMFVPLLLGGPLSDRFGRRPLVAGAALIVGIGLVSLSFGVDLTALTVCYAAMSFGMGAFLSVDQALIADVLPKQEDAAKDLGLINLAAALPQTLAPALGSVLLATFANSYTAVLLTGAVATLVCIIATARIRGVR